MKPMKWEMKKKILGPKEQDDPAHAITARSGWPRREEPWRTQATEERYLQERGRKGDQNGVDWRRPAVPEAAVTSDCSV
jgi:hypothetical protein